MNENEFATGSVPVMRHEFTAKTRHGLGPVLYLDGCQSEKPQGMVS